MEECIWVAVHPKACSRLSLTAKYNPTYCLLQYASPRGSVSHINLLPFSSECILQYMLCVKQWSSFKYFFYKASMRLSSWRGAWGTLQDEEAFLHFPVWVRIPCRCEDSLSLSMSLNSCSIFIRYFIRPKCLELYLCYAPWILRW